jgi:hypothetical protein
MNPVIINQAGPLPITVTIPWPSSNTVVVAVSGSAFVNTPNTLMSMKLTNRDGVAIGVVRQAGNPAGTHLAFPTGFHAVNGVSGDETLTLGAGNGTITDFNDHFTVALLY